MKIIKQARLNADIDTNLNAASYEIDRWLLKMNQAKHLQYYNRALKIIELATLKDCVDTNLAAALHKAGQCLLEMN